MRRGLDVSEPLFALCKCKSEILRLHKVVLYFVFCDDKTIIF